MIRFSDAANLGFHAMIDLAGHPDQAVPLPDQARRMRVSAAHLAKVMQTLRRHHLVSAIRGPAGGYRLQREPAAISLADVLRAIEGPIAVRECLFRDPVCATRCCGVGKAVAELNRQLLAFLERTTLADVAGTRLIGDTCTDNGASTRAHPGNRPTAPHSEQT